MTDLLNAGSNTSHGVPLAEMIDKNVKLHQMLACGSELMQEKAQYLTAWTQFLPELQVTLRDIQALDALYTAAMSATVQFAEVEGSSEAGVETPKHIRAKYEFHITAHELTNGIKNLLRRAYCKKYGLNLSSRRFVCAHVIAGLRRCPDKTSKTLFPELLPCGQIPYVDHPCIFQHGAVLVFTSQPYRTDAELRPALEEFTLQYGLTFRIAPEEAWHYPGQVNFYEIKRRGA